jgi:hypothetical protein
MTDARSLVQRTSSRPTNRHVKLEHGTTVGTLIYDEYTSRCVDESSKGVEASSAWILRVVFKGSADLDNRGVEEIAGYSEGHGQRWKCRLGTSEN